MRSNNTAANHLHPTKDNLSFSCLLKSTTTPQSERLLADSLGYPKSWHVRRIILKQDSCSTTATHVMTCQDTIYAGNPNHKVDVYFNHIAAMEAAINWNEGESLGWENKGGQLLPVIATFAKGDIVQVFYQPEDAWYDATILKIRMYKDEVRYEI